MSLYALGFQEIDKTKLMMVGGKGANLGELSRIGGIQVPEGFCVTAEAYKRIIGQTTELNALLDQLALLEVGGREKGRTDFAAGGHRQKDREVFCLSAGH